MILSTPVGPKIDRLFHSRALRPGTCGRTFRTHQTDKEVFFEQVPVAGREGAFDFTDATELGVTIAGQVFVRLLFEFVLAFSKWRWVCVAFSETFEALVAGLQGALWALGGVSSGLAQR